MQRFSNTTAIDRLTEAIEAIDFIRELGSANYNEFTEWYNGLRHLLVRQFGEQSEILISFDKINFERPREEFFSPPRTKEDSSFYKATVLMEQFLLSVQEKLRAENVADRNEYNDEFEDQCLHKYIHKDLLKMFQMRNKPELYNDAIANVMETLAKRVEIIAKRHGMDDGKHGANLMASAFSPKRPFVEIVTPNDVTSKTKTDVQEGFMHLFMGAFLAVRNVATHERNVPCSKVDVVRKMFFASILMNELDKIDAKERL